MRSNDCNQSMANESASYPSGWRLEIRQKAVVGFVWLVLIFLLLFGAAWLSGGLDSSSSTDDWQEVGGIGMDYKPSVYLYPEKETLIKVNVSSSEPIIYAYPRYYSGWEVTAKPNGEINSMTDGSPAEYIFWSEKSGRHYSFSSGFVVKDSDLVKFLREKLSGLGLTERECAPFFQYWYSIMAKNRYNFVHFITAEEYAGLKEELEVSPRPDSLLRVFLVFKGLDKKISVRRQELPTFERQGFTLVEWGGTEIK